MLGSASLLALMGLASSVAASCPDVGANTIAHCGVPVGEEIKYDNSKFSASLYSAERINNIA